MAWFLSEEGQRDLPAQIADLIWKAFVASGCRAVLLVAMAPLWPAADDLPVSATSVRWSRTCLHASCGWRRPRNPAAERVLAVASRRIDEGQCDLLALAMDLHCTCWWESHSLTILLRSDSTAAANWLNDEGLCDLLVLGADLTSMRAAVGGCHAILLRRRLRLGLQLESRWSK